jgi:hypothetical protein
MGAYRLQSITRSQVRLWAATKKRQKSTMSENETGMRLIPNGMIIITVRAIRHHPLPLIQDPRSYHRLAIDKESPA